jgi:hypothetical protein
MNDTFADTGALGLSFDCETGQAAEAVTPSQILVGPREPSASRPARRAEAVAAGAPPQSSIGGHS